jgi:8-oxo-dGTP diphosphatase
MRTAINSAIINSNKEILLVKKRDTWILPWGKPEAGEREIDCLQREVKEELNGATLANIIYYDDVVGTTPHKGDLLQAKVYFADLITDTLQASAEISEAKFTKDFDNYNLSDISSKIINLLKKDGKL